MPAPQHAKRSLKVVIVMNLMINLIFSLVFTILAQVIATGGIHMDTFWLNFFVSYVIQMLLGLVPFNELGAKLALAMKLKPGSTGFRMIITLVVVCFFAPIMSGAMSCFNTVILAGLPPAAWFGGWAQIILPFFIVAYIISFLLVGPLTALAMRICKVNPQLQGH